MSNNTVLQYSLTLPKLSIRLIGFLTSSLTGCNA
uniref:Uncharacterized protein n=1 Tax=Anguilla anguilla TaxID=7936 RepID=A0A0E9P9I6_ANGAN